MATNVSGDELNKLDVGILAETLVFDSQNRGLKLGQLWQNGPVILVFLRHFACIACRAHAVNVWKDRARFEKTGARLVFVGNGPPAYIEIFKSELGLEKALILTDPSLEAFRAAGFRHGFFELVQLKSILNAIRLASRGHKQKTLAAQGSNWQLGGVLAIHKSGKVLYHFISHALGDLPEESDIETILDTEAGTLKIDKDALTTTYYKDS